MSADKFTTSFPPKRCVHALCSRVVFALAHASLVVAEPIVAEGRPQFSVLADGWTAVTDDDSRTAQFEHTILITDDHVEILT